MAAALVRLADGFAGLVVTTGGTGFGPRDLTPEGTRRSSSGRPRAWPRPCAWSTRWAACHGPRPGTIGQALVLNTPGSTSGAVECLDAVLDVLPHALALLAGDHPH